MDNLLEKINSPADLKKLSVDQLPQVCTELRSFIIEALSHNPGHFAASLGVVELTVAVHYVFDLPFDKLVWDVGHQAYGHKILTGEDKRTTILIKNLPKNMTKNQLKMIIEKIANINYIYIPLFMLSDDNLRCAFVNVINSKSIIDIYLKLKKLNFKYDNPNTKIEITYSMLQGKKALIENFRDERNIFKNSQNYFF